MLLAERVIDGLDGLDPEVQALSEGKVLIEEVDTRANDSLSGSGDHLEHLG